MDQFNYQNIIAGNGFGLTITGMAIVFISLALVAGAIAQLPGLLIIFDKITGINRKDKTLESEAGAKVTSDKDQVENELMTVIGLVIHMELDRLSVDDKQKITISKRVDQRSAWAAAGKMKTFSRREKYA
ncbi:MAG: OadG family protein [Proteobacteria bacterium]|nr:OadG family protein [Pseudomonadota bacterium]